MFISFKQRFFNKRYSSIAQQMVRQRIFLARVFEVFLTGAKYKFFQLSYYTAINRWSDITAEESYQILNGDFQVEKEDEQEEKLDDDSTAGDILRQLSNSNQPLSRLNSGSRRSKRDTNEGGRNLSVDDLILVDPKQPEPDPRLHIKWIIESDNPNYIRPQIVEPNLVENSPQIVRDIPAKELSGIINSDSYNISVAFDSISKWGSSDKEGSSDKSERIVINDWRKSGCISPPRDQGYCARYSTHILYLPLLLLLYYCKILTLNLFSCYAVSSISFIEWALCMSQDNVLTPLSVQYMVSCGIQMNDETNGQIKLMGCKHGMSRQAMDFVKEYGIELEANLPYYEQETACPVLPFTAKKYKGYIRPNVRKQLRLAGTTSQLDLALKSGPIIVSMREPKNFLAYGGGFIESCEPKGGHAMLVVGNMIEDGIEYLLIKNSFGHYWGYDGYFKFKRTPKALSECVKEFIVPVINFPGKKSKKRRILSYLARQNTIDNILLREEADNDKFEDDTDNEDISGTELAEILLYHRRLRLL